MKNDKNSLNGIVLAVIGIALFLLHYLIGGSDLKDFFSGMLLGLSIVVMLVGVFVSTYSIFRK